MPFRGRAGRRVLVEGIPAALIRSFLQSYLRRLPNPDGTTLVITRSSRRTSKAD